MLRILCSKEACVEINEIDAARFGTEDGDLVEVASRRGSVEAVAMLTEEVMSGQVFMPMHYVETNYLTFSAFEPLSHEPGYKHCAVRLTKKAPPV